MFTAKTPDKLTYGAKRRFASLTDSREIWITRLGRVFRRCGGDLKAFTSWSFNL